MFVFCRVKELGSEDLEAGAGANSRRPPELDYPEYPTAESPHPSDSDLALLQSRNVSFLFCKTECKIWQMHIDDRRG